MNLDTLHALLKRQLKRHLKVNSDGLPPETFLTSVDEAYKDFDRERNLLQRAMELSSKELLSKNESLKMQANKLARLNSELDEFAFAVAHDLREPLRSIVSYTQLLQNKLHDKLTVEEMGFLKNVVINAQKMDTMLVGMSRYADIHGDIKNDLVDLKDVINTAIQQLSGHPHSTNAIYIVPPMPIIRGSKSQLIVLFRNIFQNALKHSSASSLTIEVSWIEREQHIDFTIKDNGVGIKDDIINNYLKIFKKSGNRHEDAGMGLAICKKIVLNHGGEMSIRNVYSKGLAIHFTLLTNRLSELSAMQ